MPNKRGPNRRVGKKFRNLINGGVGICEKALNDYTRTERTIKVVMTLKSKIDTAIRYVAMQNWT